MSKKIRKKSNEEIKVKPLYRSLSATSDPNQRIIDDNTLENILNLLRQEKSTSWRNLCYAMKIISLIIETDFSMDVRMKLFQRSIISLLFSLFSMKSQKNEELRSIILDCLFYMTALAYTHEEIVKQCNGITVLYDYYISQGPIPYETLHGIKVLRIFRVLLKSSKFKNKVLQSGIEKNLLKKSNMITSLDIYKKQIKRKTATSDRPLTARSYTRSKKNSISEHEPRKENTDGPKIRLSRISGLQHSEDSNIERTEPKQPFYLIYSNPVSPLSRRKKSKSISIQNKNRIRVKCRWDEDLRFIWVNKGIGLKLLLEVIEKEYQLPVSIGQLKFCDPSNPDDLMTITKQEDIDLCFENNKPELYIISNRFLTPHQSPLYLLNGSNPSSQMNIRTSQNNVTFNDNNNNNNNNNGSSSSSRSTPTSPSVNVRRTINLLPSKSSKTNGMNLTPWPMQLRREKTDHPTLNFVDKAIQNHTSPRRNLRSLNRSEKQNSDIFRGAGTTTLQETSEVSSLATNRLSTDSSLNPRWLISSQDLKINEESLGVGYFGEVRLGLWRGITVACKFVYDKSFRKKSDLELFEKEVNILSSLRHPNIILYMGVCLDNTHHKIIVMEYMEMGSLHELLRTDQFPMINTHKIATEIALGMNYLHGENILHRDLTSKNILLSKHLEAKVADFGLSKMKLNQPESLSYTMGSVAWMAPEVLANAKNFTTSSDVYSYAIVLWELWTGESPCPREVSTVNLANKVLYDNYRPALHEHVPESWKALIRLCWQTEYSERPSFDRIIKILDTIETTHHTRKEENISVNIKRNNNEEDYEVGLGD